jgi:hypothetical protein
MNALEGFFCVVGSFISMRIIWWAVLCWFSGGGGGGHRSLPVVPSGPLLTCSRCVYCHGPRGGGQLACHVVFGQADVVLQQRLRCKVPI